VIIDGVVRKRLGKLVGVDIDVLKRRFSESAARIAEDFKTVDRAGIEAFWSQIFPHLENMES